MLVAAEECAQDAIQPVADCSIAACESAGLRGLLRDRHSNAGQAAAAVSGKMRAMRALDACIGTNRAVSDRRRSTSHAIAGRAWAS